MKIGSGEDESMKRDVKSIAIVGKLTFPSPYKKKKSWRNTKKKNEKFPFFAMMREERVRI